MQQKEEVSEADSSQPSGGRSRVSRRKDLQPTRHSERIEKKRLSLEAIPPRPARPDVAKLTLKAKQGREEKETSRFDEFCVERYGNDSSRPSSREDKELFRARHTRKVQRSR